MGHIKVILNMLRFQICFGYRGMPDRLDILLG